MYVDIRKETVNSDPEKVFLAAKILRSHLRFTVKHQKQGSGSLEFLHQKILAISKTNDKVQRELTEFQNWVHGNDMQLAIDKCAQTKFRGNLNNLILNGITLEQKTSIKYLGVFDSQNLNSRTHIYKRLKKVNRFLYWLRVYSIANTTLQNTLLSPLKTRLEKTRFVAP